MKLTTKALLVMAGTTLGLVGGPAAYGAPPPIVITTLQDAFHPAHTPPTGTFQATGLSGCDSGTYADKLVYFTPDGTRVVVNETYSCLGGATFVARLALHIAAIAPDGVQAAQGTWRIVSSTTGLAGSGSLWGQSAGCSPVGSVFGDCTGTSSGLIVGNSK